MAPPRVQQRRSSWLRMGRGGKLRATAREPEQLLELFEFEACPFCRKVREVMTEMGLSYVSRTCAKGANTRQEVVQRGGKTQFPFFYDPNTEAEMYESEDIISYLLRTYGQGRSTIGRLLSPLNTLRSGLTGFVSRGGFRVEPGCRDRQQPARLIELFNVEASPACHQVRTVLGELNLDAVIRSAAPGSLNQQKLKALIQQHPSVSTGDADTVSNGASAHLPFLIDQNSGFASGDGGEIVQYLKRTYGCA